MLLGERQTEQPEITHLGHDVHREGVRAVRFVGLRCDDRLGEVAHHRGELAFLIGQLEHAHFSSVVMCATC